MSPQKSTIKAPSKPVHSRLYIGGLSTTVSAEDLKERFNSFGTIVDVEIPRPDGGFGYVELKTTEAQLRRCQTALNNAKWKGCVMKIEEAKMDYKKRMELERIQMRKADRLIEKGKKKKLKMRLKRQPVVHAKDMSMVTDETSREGWKKCRYGRILPVLDIRHPKTHKVVKVDPLKFKLNFKRLELEGREKSVAELTVYPEVDIDEVDVMSVDSSDSDQEKFDIQDDQKSDICEISGSKAESVSISDYEKHGQLERQEQPFESNVEKMEDTKDSIMNESKGEPEVKVAPKPFVTGNHSLSFPEPVQSNELFDVKTNLRSLVFGESTGGLFDFGANQETEAQNDTNAEHSSMDKQEKDTLVSFQATKTLPLNHMLATLQALQKYHEPHGFLSPVKHDPDTQAPIIPEIQALPGLLQPIDPETLKSSPFFFHHMDTDFDSTSAQERVWYRSGRVFVRDKPEEAIVADWEEKKADLTKEYKDRHREALRMKRRLNKKRQIR